MELFEVGGCIRDEILGIPSKDIDFSVVLGDKDYYKGDMTTRADGSPGLFAFMEAALEYKGFRLIPEARKPEFLTARGFFPKDHPVYPGRAADFVLARKERDYSDGRRPDFVEAGTLEDDLARRDFTMNAIAKAADGTLIDPFGGQQDIADRIIRAVGDAHTRIIEEDALRGMRALRFAVTKGFDIDWRVQDVLCSNEFSMALRNIATERVQEELDKMFKVDTVESLELIRKFDLSATLFNNTGLRLMPTMRG